MESKERHFKVIRASIMTSAAIALVLGVVGLFTSPGMVEWMLGILLIMQPMILGYTIDLVLRMHLLEANVDGQEQLVKQSNEQIAKLREEVPACIESVSTKVANAVGLHQRLLGCSGQRELLATLAESLDDRVLAEIPFATLRTEVEDTARSAKDELGRVAEGRLIIPGMRSLQADRHLVKNATRTILAIANTTDHVVDFWMSREGELYWDAHLERLDAEKALRCTRVFILSDGLTRTSELASIMERQNGHEQVDIRVMHEVAIGQAGVIPLDMLIIDRIVSSLTHQEVSGEPRSVEICWAPEAAAAINRLVKGFEKLWELSLPLDEFNMQQKPAEITVLLDRIHDKSKQ